MSKPSEAAPLLDKELSAPLKAMLELTRESHSRGLSFSSLMIVTIAFLAQFVAFNLSANDGVTAFAVSLVILAIWGQNLQAQRRVRRQLELTLEILRDLQHRTRTMT
jgi:hypothetical protein